MGGAAEVLAFLSGKTYYLATVEDGQPRVRPFGLIMEYGGKLYFGTGDFKPTYRQLLANPRFELSATADNGQDWIRVSGKAVPDDDDAVRQALFERFPFVKSMYAQPGGPKLALFYMAEARAVFASMAGETTVIEF